LLDSLLPELSDPLLSLRLDSLPDSERPDSLDSDREDSELPLLLPLLVLLEAEMLLLLPLLLPDENEERELEPDDPGELWLDPERDRLEDADLEEEPPEEPDLPDELLDDPDPEPELDDRESELLPLRTELLPDADPPRIEDDKLRKALILARSRLRCLELLIPLELEPDALVELSELLELLELSELSLLLLPFLGKPNFVSRRTASTSATNAIVSTQSNPRASTWQALTLMMPATNATTRL